MKGIVLLLCILALAFSTCQKEVSQEESTKPQGPATIKMLDDSEIRQLIETFSTDLGEVGQKAFDKLNSFPRADLIRRLLELRNTIVPDDSLQPQVSFVLCHLDHEYQANADIVASSLSRTPRFRNFDGDQAASQIVRLIKRGDKNLMPVLLRSVGWADGALATELSDFFGDELVNETEIFLEALQKESKEIRFQTYQLIEGPEQLGSEEKQIIKRRLLAIGPKSKLYPVAQEILASRLIRL